MPTAFREKSRLVKRDQTRMTAPLRDALISPMVSALVKNLQQVLAEKDLTPFAAATRAGLGESFVRDILRGKVQSPRADSLQKLADALDVSVERLTGGRGRRPPLGRDAAQTAGGRLPVRFLVQAGAWFEEDDTVQAPRFAPILADPTVRATQWLEEVRGDSIDLIAGDGALLQVASWADLGMPLRDGQFVVAQRARLGGGLRERTVKRVSTDRGVVRLTPYSSNPRWSEPLSLSAPGDDDSTTVTVEALVLWVHTQLKATSGA